MKCLHPLFALPEYRKDGVFIYHVIGAAEKIMKDQGCKDVTELVSNPVGTDPYGRPAYPQLLPCQKCINCRLDYSRQWAYRMCLEKMDHPEDRCWFLTLTYDDDHLPKVGLSFERRFMMRPGEYESLSTLRMQDCSDFVKNLRRQLQYHYGEEGFRYFAASEYGDRTFRPHIHMIAYELPISDLEEDRHSRGYFQSKFLDKVWRNGHVCIAPVEFSCCAYVSRYVCKKLSGALYQEKYAKFGIEPESTRCSRNPGIGMRWYNPADYGDRQKAVAPGRLFHRVKAFDRKLKEDDAWSYRLLDQQEKARRVMILQELASPLNMDYVQDIQNRIYEAEQNLTRKKFF